MNSTYVLGARHGTPAERPSPANARWRQRSSPAANPWRQAQPVLGVPSSAPGSASLIAPRPVAICHWEALPPRGRGKLHLPRTPPRPGGDRRGASRTRRKAPSCASPEADRALSTPPGCSAATGLSSARMSRCKLCRSAGEFTRGPGLRAESKSAEGTGRRCWLQAGEVSASRRTNRCSKSPPTRWTPRYPPPSPASCAGSLSRRTRRWPAALSWRSSTRPATAGGRRPRQPPRPRRWRPPPRRHRHPVALRRAVTPTRRPSQCRRLRSTASQPRRRQWAGRWGRNRHSTRQPPHRRRPPRTAASRERAGGVGGGARASR